MNTLLKGVIFSLLASILFGALYYYVVLLRPLDGVIVFAWRILFTVPGLMLILSVYRAWPNVWRLCQRIRHEPRLRLILPILTAILGIQLWLFVWAPLHGKALDVSLGFFLLPLTMVLVGRLFLHEHLSPLQTCAVLCAIVGVGHELWRTLAFSWATTVIMCTYPPYFLLRRWYNIEALPGLFLEMLLLLPVCIGIVYFSADSAVFTHTPRLLWQLPMLGVLSAAGLSCYLSASRLLPMGLFGLLGYVEPILLFGVATLLLGEVFTSAQWLSYGAIWMAVILLALDGVLRLRTHVSRTSTC